MSFAPNVPQPTAKNPFFPKARLGIENAAKSWAKECQLFSYQAEIKRLGLVTMCLAKIGPNAGPGFQGGLQFVQQLMARLRGFVAPAPALKKCSWCSWEEEKQVELFDAVTPPPHLQLQLARN